MVAIAIALPYEQEGQPRGTKAVMAFREVLPQPIHILKYKLSGSRLHDT